MKIDFCYYQEDACKMASEIENGVVTIKSADVSKFLDCDEFQERLGNAGGETGAYYVEVDGKVVAMVGFWCNKPVVDRPEYKLQILKENFRSSEDEDFREYVSCVAESDPGFFRWLYDDEHLKDFENPNEESWNEFIDNLNV